MRKILVADIFGNTSSLKDLALDIGENAEIIDPYAGAERSFADEAEAYVYFMENVGLQRYCEIVRGHLATVSQQTEIIGFSVGASAVWQLSETLNPLIFRKAICFYGSQIRHHQNVNPCVDIELVLPKSEPTFDIANLSEQLSKKSRVKIHKTKYLHGFMNHHSKNFDSGGYHAYMGWLRTIASCPIARGDR